MARRTTITKESIIEAAFQITKSTGFSAVNARSIAKYLNASTQPIYSSFSDMENLKSEVINKANAYYNEFLLRHHDTQERYREIGINYIQFAQAEKWLFRLLFMTKRFDENITNLSIDDNEEYIISLIKSYKGLTIENARKIYKMMWIYTHGIATMIVNEIALFSKEEIEDLLTSAFIPILKSF